MQTESEVPKALRAFAKQIGALEAIICDSAQAQKSKEVRNFLTSIGTTLRLLEEGTPWSNRAELYVGLLKSATRKDMKTSMSPLVFWDYCMERRARINNLTAKNLFQLEGRNPHYSVTGQEGDISNICMFDWESEVPKALRAFAKQIGAPEAIICDSALAQKSKEVQNFLTSIETTLLLLEEGTPWSNRAELYVVLLKSATRKDMKTSMSPLVFWDYRMAIRARINDLTVKNLFQLEGRNLHCSITR